ncbi:MAG: C2H2-type zinc finger protein [Thermoproteota archaeon]|nr:C2H2-type zinc finger protein [Thermoproteota archaeon]
MTAEIEEIRKRWVRLRVCNVCSKNFRSSREMREHKANHHSKILDCTANVQPLFAGKRPNTLISDGDTKFS